MAFSERIKISVKRKAHFMCCLCRSIDVEVHHIVPQEENGPDTEDNAAPLCPSCHETFGGNPKKRKLIRDARDLWFEVCEKKYSPEYSILNKILKTIESIKPKSNNVLKTKEKPLLLQTTAHKPFLSIGQIIDIFNKYIEPKKEPHKTNFEVTYILLFKSKGNTRSDKDKEYNFVRNEFLHVFGGNLSKKLTLYLIKSYKIDWTKGITETIASKLISGCLTEMFCLLHHYDLKIKEFFVDVSFESDKQFYYSLKKGKSRSVLKKYLQQIGQIK